MKNVLLILLVALSSNVFGQIVDEGRKRVPVYIHRQSGDIISAEDLQYTKGTGLENTVRYPFKITRDTMYYYLDEDVANVPVTIDRLAQASLNKEIKIHELVDLEGVSYGQERLENKVIVLNFWGTHCRPCIAEMPELNELVSLYKNKDVLFFAPIKEGDTSVLISFLSRRKFDYNVIPGAIDLFVSLNAFGLPTHAIIDKNGILRFTQMGGNKDDIVHVLKSEIDKCL